MGKDKKGAKSRTRKDQLAVLIDSENVSAGNWPRIAALAAGLGEICTVRAYTCHPTPRGWSTVSEVTLVDGRPSTGSNAADFLLAMDAAVLASDRTIDAVALVTGDDGFATIAQDLQRRGVRVIAMVPINGGSVPRTLASVADLTVVIPPETKPVELEKQQPPLVTSTPSQGGWSPEAVRSIARHCQTTDDGWIPMSIFGSALKGAGIKRPKGSLFESIGKLGIAETKGTQARGWVRLKPD